MAVTWKRSGALISKNSKSNINLWRKYIPGFFAAGEARIDSSSKKLIKGGLGFFLSPREEARDGASGNASNLNLPITRNTNNWNNESLNLEPNDEIEAQDKDYIDDLPVIPSLDDFADDDLTNQIAKAPLVGVKQVTSFKDLETDLLRQSAFSTLEEVNLQVLIKLLHPESCLDEPDSVWTKDSLFNELVTRFNERKT